MVNTKVWETPGSIGSSTNHSSGRDLEAEWYVRCLSPRMLFIDRIGGLKIHLGDKQYV